MESLSVAYSKFLERIPILQSSTEKKIRRLKRELVLQLFLRNGEFWNDVKDLRSEWEVTLCTTLPEKARRNTHIPMHYLPSHIREERLAFLKHKDGRFLDNWWDALKPLRKRYVPESLRSGAIWEDFLGACVMCKPPEESLIEFSEFGELITTIFWPVVECDRDDVEPEELYRMVSPPVERRILERSPKDGEVFMEYIIKPSAETTREDVVNAFRAIKAANRQPDGEVLVKHEGGRPSLDPLVALQCAILHEEHNGTDPEDGRIKHWTYKRLADEYSEYGIKNERSAREHAVYGKMLRKDS